MPALSKKQQKFMGIVRSIQKGEQPASKFSKDAQDVAKDMKKKDVKKFASTKHKGLPMKKEILGKLKEMIKQELSEYTYGVGDVVKDVNPTCPHYGAEGKVKSVNPRSVIFIVKNKGKNFKPGMELEKSHDQMKKMNESINEMSAKTKKIISKLGKKEKEMFIDMVDMLGFDQVMADYKRDKKAFKQALKDMSENIIKEEGDEVQTGKQYTKLWLQAIELVIKQANGLKGALAKHPIRRDVNKLKAVENLFKKFIKPAIEREGGNRSHYAPNITRLKKYLSDGKFKASIQYILRDTLKQGNFRQNSWYYLDDKETNLIKKMDKVLYDIETKMDNANLENINEKKKMFPPDKMTPKQAKEYKRFIDYAKMGIEYKIDMSLFESINEDESVKETKVGNYQTKYFHMCPGAKGLFDGIESKVKNMDIAERSAMLQDALFFIEKHILEDDETGSPEGYMLVANNLATNIMAMAKMMGLEKEHHYIQGHIDTIKKALSGEDTKSTADKLDEDGHTDVASSKRKVMIMVDDSNKLLNKLNGMNKEDSLPSWWSDKITLSQNYLAKATDYITNPVESIKEFRDKREADIARDQIGHKALYMIGAKDFVFGKSGGKKSLVFKIMRNSKGVSHIRMRLTSLDLYDMEFLAIRAGKIKVKSKEKGVYGDQLGGMIKKNTGLNVRL